MSREYPWYEIVEGDDIQQGDFIEACKVIIPKYSFNDSPDEITSTNTLPPQIESEYDILSVVIVSQSCDLKNEKVANALVCPRWPYTRVIEKNPKFGSKDTFERIKQGREYRYCMLDKSDLPDLPSEIQIVDLNIVFSIPYRTMKQIALSKGKRLRLCSPYREKLAQAFAYFHMRVALPNDLPNYETIKAAYRH